MKYKYESPWYDSLTAFCLAFGVFGMSYIVACLGHDMYPKAFWPVVVLTIVCFVVGLRLLFRDV